LKSIDTDKENFGKSDLYLGKKIMVEYAHPNTHKELHIGHMRTLIVGESLSRILEFSKANVFRANYQGDIGPHVAKAIWGIRQILQQNNQTLNDVNDISSSAKAHLLGKGYILGNEKYEQFKTEINDINNKLYEHAPDIQSDYQTTRNWSLDYYHEFYQRFNTKFDKLYFESEMADLGKKIVQDNINKVFEQSQGAVIFDGEKYGLHKRVFITQAGYPTYEAKDMALAQVQYQDFTFDTIIHVVANEQAGYFQVIIKAIELLYPELKGKQYHLSMGMVDLVNKKMSSRTGDIITVDDLLDEIKSNLKTLSQSDDNQVLEQTTLGAVKYSVLKVDPTANVKFDIKESIDLNGNSGPYIQYTYARAQSVLSKATNLKNHNFSDYSDPNQKLNPEELSVLKKLIHFPETIIDSANNYSPSALCNYVYELAQTFNTFYNAHQIINSENEALRLALTASTAQVLKNSLTLLGIAAPEKM